MLLPIYAYGHSVLKQKAKPVDQSFPKLNKLIDDMWETMEGSNGIGLAAPQIGKSLQLFVVDTRSLFNSDSDSEEFKDTHLRDFRQVFLNPIILNESGELFTFTEGCLSIPDVREDVVRYSEIEIQYFDQNFNKYRKKFDGLIARVVQHEYDHIQGILFTDLLSSFKKRILKGKLKNIAKGNCQVDYLMKFPK